MNEEQEVEEYLHQIAQKYEAGAGDYPHTPEKDTQLNFMRDVVEEEDDFKQSKTANLTEAEAGHTKVSVLDYLRISSYAESEGLSEVSDFLRRQALFISGVSLGRKAKLIDTLFTVRRETRNLGTPRETTKKGLFGSTTIKEGEL